MDILCVCVCDVVCVCVCVCVCIYVRVGSAAFVYGACSFSDKMLSGIFILGLF